MKIRFFVDSDAIFENREPQPGDAFYYAQDGVDPAGITFCCPGGCGHFGGVSFVGMGGNPWKWDGNREAPTVTPSILHDRDKCGWHGYLTAGEFKPC